MGRMMAALPSFLTPPRGKKQQSFEVRYPSDDESPPSSPIDQPTPQSRKGRYRAPGTLNNNTTNNNSGNVSESTGELRRNRALASKQGFVMPHERARPESFAAPNDRAVSPPPGYNPPSDANRRQTWGAPGSRGLEDPHHSGGSNGRMNETIGAEAQPVVLSLDGYKTALKEWKKHHNVFMSGFQDYYVLALQQRFARIEPELEAALHAYCGSQELQICMRHWEQESKRLPSAGLTFANAMRGLVRDAWNEVVVLDEQAANGQTMLEMLRRGMEDAHQAYLKTLEGSKENLWHTLDFNVDGTQNMRPEIRESYWGQFDKLQILKEEHACGIPILVIPELAPSPAPSEGRRPAESMPTRHR
ncbi:hypothetical protein BP5796_06833 [Coleophoma crateriformis]|uniref:Uncharacterized protein n=1 Tax=Coleophoma crateriformis TaxID=565419 RepID=A0A3D8RPJ9_9HELO|nr:hypothetical protein BP5796_06833 [Coleophoma crateriformis]